MNKKIELYTIDGMSCASCVRHVQKAIESLPEVESAQVNLANSMAKVEYKNGLLNSAQIIKAVEDAGYQASLQTENNEEDSKKNFQLRI